MFVQCSALQTAADVLTAIISIITKLFMPVPVLSLLIPKGFASFLCRCMGRGISPLSWLYPRLRSLFCLAVPTALAPW